MDNNKKRPYGSWKKINADLDYCTESNRYWKPSEKMVRCEQSANWAGWIGVGAIFKEIVNNGQN